MSTELLAQAFDASHGALAGVGPDQLAEPTPCRSWDVAALANHMVASPRYAAGLVAHGAGTEVDTDFAAGDLLGAHDETRRLTLEVFGAPGALDRSVTLPFGDVPVSLFIMFVAGDQFMHAWDVARATGQPTTLDPDQARTHLEFARGAVMPAFRGEEGERQFGPERPAPAGAGPVDQLAAFLGRDVD